VTDFFLLLDEKKKKREDAGMVENNSKVSTTNIVKQPVTLSPVTLFGVNKKHNGVKTK